MPNTSDHGTRQRWRVPRIVRSDQSCASAGSGNVCPWASPGCIAACLNKSGHALVYPAIIQARINRTKLFFADRPLFMALLCKDIDAARKKAERDGLQLAIRLNGTSDLVWEKYQIGQWHNIFERYPDVTFYDYTKSVNRALQFAAGLMPHNYSLTLSRTEDNWSDCVAALEGGCNVAAVWRDALPDTYAGFAVVDGDTTDERFTDARGVIVGLTAKAKAKTDSTGFVIA